MTKVTEAGKDKNISSAFPTPIATVCQSLFRDKQPATAQEILSVYDALTNFIGCVSLSNYIKDGSSSEKINLILVSTIKTLNSRNWYKIIYELVPIMKNRLFIPEMSELYRNLLCPEDSLLAWMEDFRDRVSVDIIPLDRFETEEAAKKMIQLLEYFKFLENYRLVESKDDGVWLLRGLKPSLTDDYKKTEKNGIRFYGWGNNEYLDMDLFFSKADSKGSIGCKDFSSDKEAYREILKTEALSSGVREYQKLLSGKPAFEEKKSYLMNMPAGELERELAKVLSTDASRILLEAYPGGGKTIFVTGFEKHIDTSNLEIAKYYLEDMHLLSSSTLFSRFFYRKLNECLDKPHPINMSGAGWTEFKSLVTKDFVRCGKILLLIIDSIEWGFDSFPGEKVSVEEFLSYDFPWNLKILMTARTGYYPRKFDARIKMPPMSVKEACGVFSEMGIPEGKIRELVDFYGGQRGYLMEFTGDKLIQLDKIPERIVSSFMALLYRYNFFHPIREKVFRCIAENSRPISLYDIAGHIKIPAPVVLQHLNKIQPILKISMIKQVIHYSLFIPAFSEFIREFKFTSTYSGEK